MSTVLTIRPKWYRWRKPSLRAVGESQEDCRPVFNILPFIDHPLFLLGDEAGALVKLAISAITAWTLMGFPV